MKVVKQTPILKVFGPSSVSKGSRPTIKVKANGVNAEVRGTVKIEYLGKKVYRQLSGGTTQLKLAKLTRTTKVTVTYQGNATFNRVSTSKTIRVR